MAVDGFDPEKLTYTADGSRVFCGERPFVVWVTGSGIAHIEDCPTLQRRYDPDLPSSGFDWRRDYSYGNRWPEDDARAALAGYKVCQWCRRTLSGAGRVEYLTLSALLDAIGVCPAMQGQMADHLAGLEDEPKYLVGGGSYGYIGYPGELPLAEIHKTWLRCEGKRVEFASSTHRGGGRRRAIEERRERCPKCHVERSASGACFCM